MPVRALLLDMDGTLADSLPLMRRLYAEFLEARGGRPSDAEFYSLNGVPLLGIMRALQATHGFGGDPAEHVEAYLARIHEHYHEVPPIAGARELFSAARAADVRIAIVTSSSAGLAHAWSTGVELPVDTVIGCEDIRIGKPDPEPFLLALERLGCSAADALAVEDAPLGATSAVAAGVRTWIRGERGTYDWPAVAGQVERLDELIPELDR